MALIKIILDLSCSSSSYRSVQGVERKRSLYAIRYTVISHSIQFVSSVAAAAVVVDVGVAVFHFAKPFAPLPPLKNDRFSRIVATLTPVYLDGCRHSAYHVRPIRLMAQPANANEKMLFQAWTSSKKAYCISLEMMFFHG